jgi:hypothetical protein
MMNYLTVIELAAFFSTLLAWKITRPVYLRWVSAVLAFTLLNESILVPFVEGTKLLNQNILYNAFSLVDMFIWLFVFFSAATNPRYRRIIAVTGILCLFYSLLELFFLRNWKYFHVDSFRLYELAIIVFAVIYLVSLLSKAYHNLLGDLFFWCCAACIIYHGILFLNFTTVAEHNYWKIKDAARIFFILQEMASVFYYLLICAGFLIFFLKYRGSKASFQRL